ncbi:hypothetical protein EYZ01_13940 [Hafnia alvei]|uniref:hypothetical protein n=1 Tax=Enterobacterales TaxID=91347 RepID=UPI001034F894|nr:hypothetical protein [Scandinavium tedordense]MCS2169372.1 hypothetical protein [Scandinavium tedordense]TBL38419.1 hypothetical protein EYZ01_13940 [Hafnia alvei]
MIDVKNNIEHIKYYFYNNEMLFKNEIERISSFNFCDKYLLTLSTREFLDFIELLIDEIIESDIEIPCKITDLLNYILGKDIVVKNDKGEHILQDVIFNDFSDIQKRVDTLKLSHQANQDRELLLHCVSKSPTKKSDKRRL